MSQQDFQLAIQAAINDLKAHIDGKVEDLVKNLHTVHLQLQIRIQHAEAKHDGVVEVLHCVTDKIRHLEEKVEYLEGQDRRMNLILTGVPEQSQETWDETGKTVLKVFEDDLKVKDANRIVIQRTHRMGGYVPNAQRPRRIIVKFAFHGDKERVLGNRRNLAGSGIYLDEQFPTESGRTEGACGLTSRRNGPRE